MLPLPHNKKWHLFVSHSTSSEHWARKEIVAKLSGPPHHMRVAACYQSMPDSSRYDDKEIRTRMRESCVVLIAITPSYLISGRLLMIIVIACIGEGGDLSFAFFSVCTCMYIVHIQHVLCRFYLNTLSSLCISVL